MFFVVVIKSMVGDKCAAAFMFIMTDDDFRVTFAVQIGQRHCCVTFLDTAENIYTGRMRSINIDRHANCRSRSCLEQN